MFKYFFKTTLVSILCGSLLMLNFDHHKLTINSSRAESVTTGSKVDSDMMASLTMIAIGAISSRLVMYGKITPDIAVAAAAGTAFIAGDIAANRELKSALKEITTEIKTTARKDLNDEQRQYIIRLIDTYKKAKETASMKKTFQLAAAAAFATAAATAYFMSGAELTAATACEAALGALNTASASTSTANAACVPVAAEALLTVSGYSLDRSPPSPTCAKLATVNSLRSSAIAKLTIAGAACAHLAPAVALVNTACNSMFGMNIGYESGCLPPATLAISSTLIFAALGMKEGAIGAALSGIAFYYTNVIDNALFVPMHRAIMWGVLAGLAYGASSAVDSQIAKIDQDIKKLENILNVMESNQSGSRAKVANKNSPSTHINSINSSINGAIATNKDVTLDTNLPCMTSDNLNASGKDCKSLSNLVKDMPLPDGLSDSLKTNIGSALNLGNSLNGNNRISQATMQNASGLGSSYAVSKKLMDDQKKKLIDTNNNLKKPHDLSSFENNFNDGLKTAFDDGLKKNKISRDSLAMNMGVNPMLNDLNKHSEDKLKKLGKNVDLTSMPMPVLPTGKSMSTLLSDDAKKENQEVATTNAIDDYEVNNDIHTDKSENIFNVISSRYQKSGYPRLFKRLSE